MSHVDEQTPVDLMDIDADDDNALRVIVVVPWELPGQWEQWRALLTPGPVPIVGGVGRTVFDGAARRLREPVRRRMLSDEYRSHYVYEDLAPVFVSEENRTSLDTAPFRAFAWDVLKIETISTCSARSTRSSRESATKVLIAMHLVLQDPSSPRAFSSVRNLTQRPKGRTEIAHEVRRVLSLLSGSAPDNVGHGFGATDQSGHEVIAPYTITYVPYDVVASEQGTGLELDDYDVRTEQERAAGGQYRGLRQSVTDPGSGMTRERVIVSSWRWGHLPRRTDETFQDGLFEQRAQQLHRLSQTWVAYAGSHGCSFCQVQQGGFFPLAQVEGRFIEAILLMLLQRYRASSLMARLADVQPRAADEVDRVIELDSEAVGFVVSEQWTMMTDADRQLDAFLTYLLDTYRIPLLVEEARDQAHRLRENVLMRIGRAEQQADEERARSTRIMEIALAVLTFIGLPLSVFLEIWSNWESSQGIAVRYQHVGSQYIPWGVVLTLGVLASTIIGGGTWLAIDKQGGRVARRGKRP